MGDSPPARAGPAPTHVSWVIEPVPLSRHDWYVFGAGTLVLAAVAALACRRARRNARGRSRVLRIVAAAAAFAVTTDAMFTVGRLLADANPARAAREAALELGLTIVFAIPYALVDVLIGLARPRRSRKWLIAAMPAFVATSIVAIAAPMTLEPFGLQLLNAQAVVRLVIGGAAAGLMWWALLPPVREQVAHRFE